MKGGQQSVPPLARENQPEVTETEADFEERIGFEILSEKNIEQFQEVMKDYKVSYNMLNDYFEIYPEAFGGEMNQEVEPSFYLDFDNKVFYSFFTEPGSYEDFVPTGWRGVFERETKDIIPVKAKEK